MLVDGYGNGSACAILRLVHVRFGLESQQQTPIFGSTNRQLCVCTHRQICTRHRFVYNLFVSRCANVIQFNFHAEFRVLFSFTELLLRETRRLKLRCMCLWLRVLHTRPKTPQKSSANFKTLQYTHTQARLSAVSSLRLFVCVPG